MGIPFTQYLLPHGRKTSVFIDRPDAIEAMAHDICAAGYCFECECLSRDALVSFTITRHEDDVGDVCIRICPNGPRVPETIDSLVKEGYKKIVFNE